MADGRSDDEPAGSAGSEGDRPSGGTAPDAPATPLADHLPQWPGFRSPGPDPAPPADLTAGNLGGGAWPAPPDPVSLRHQGDRQGGLAGAEASGGFTPWPTSNLWDLPSLAGSSDDVEPPRHVGPPHTTSQFGSSQDGPPSNPPPGYPPGYSQEGGYRGYGGYGGYGAGWPPPSGPGIPGGGYLPPYGPGYPLPPPPPSRPRRRYGLGSVAIVLILVALVVIGRVVTASNSSGAGSNPGAGAPANASAVAQCLDPSVVNIFTTLGFEQERAAGTGIVLTSRGIVLTNNHVIDGATQINATDVGNGQTYSATVLGYDRSDDVAILQLAGASGLATAALGNSSTLSVGAPVVAVGNAGGAGGTPSFAGGSVTALNQSITATDDLDNTSEDLNGLIQVNAGIQPGDSGGPLAGTDCKVVGMDTAASSGFELQAQSTQGFAIPINEAVSIGREIRGGHSGNLIHIGPTAFLGVGVQTTNNGPGSTSGATVLSVQTGEPADEAGLMTGDVITSIAGHTIRSASDLTYAMEQLHPGETVVLQWVTQAGMSQSAQVQLASGPAS